MVLLIRHFGVQKTLLMVTAVSTFNTIIVSPDLGENIFNSSILSSDLTTRILASSNSNPGGNSTHSFVPPFFDGRPNQVDPNMGGGESTNTPKPPLGTPGDPNSRVDKSKSRREQAINFDFKEIGFSSTRGETLTFKNCTLDIVSFRKSELENCVFKSCQLISVSFDRASLLQFNFINCKLNYVSFNAGNFCDFKFENSQLQNVSFAGSLLDNVKIKNSSLEKIEISGVRAYREVSKNGVLYGDSISIEDYDSFLREIT